MLVVNLFRTLSSIVLRSDSAEIVDPPLTKAGLLKPPIAPGKVSVHGAVGGASAIAAFVAAKVVAVDPAARNATQHVAASRNATHVAVDSARMMWVAME